MPSGKRSGARSSPREAAGLSLATSLKRAAPWLAALAAAFLVARSASTPGGALFWGLLFGLIAGIATRRALSRTSAARLVPPATALDLAWIRILTCGVLAANVVWEDLASSALLPRELYRPLGVMTWLELDAFRGLLANGTALALLEHATLVLLLLALVGFRPAITLRSAAACYVVFAGILRGYAWFFHFGIVPLYLLLVLSFTPCADALSLDRWWAKRRGKRVSGCSPEAYGLARYACWVTLAIPYVAAGISKIIGGGLTWWSAENMRWFIYRDALSPMEFDFGIAERLHSAPDVLFAVIALSALAGELVYGLVLFSARMRIVLPIVMASMHFGILALQGILFFDLILLQLVFVDASWLRSRLPASWSKVLDAWSPARGKERAWQGGALLVAAVVAVLAVPVATRQKFYPLSSWPMYSSPSKSSKVVYFVPHVHVASGERREVDYSDAIGALADSRYRQLLRMAFQERHEKVVREFLTTHARVANEGRPADERIVAHEIEAWEWDSAGEPGPEEGSVYLGKFQMRLDAQAER